MANRTKQNNFNENFPLYHVTCYYCRCCCYCSHFGALDKLRSEKYTISNPLQGNRLLICRIFSNFFLFSFRHFLQHDSLRTFNGRPKNKLFLYWVLHSELCMFHFAIRILLFPNALSFSLPSSFSICIALLASHRISKRLRCKQELC